MRFESIAPDKLRDYIILDSASAPPMLVIAVAVLGDRGDDWAVYLGVGMGTDQHWLARIARTGTKVEQAVGERWFPHLADRYTWRA